MKSYTDLKQSKKLAEILPLETADSFYAPDAGIIINEPYITFLNGERNIPAYNGAVPCWSLAALLNAVNFSTINLHYDNARRDWIASATIYDSTKHCTKYETTRELNLIDTCYEMILKLNELNLL